MYKDWSPLVSIMVACSIMMSCESAPGPAPVDHSAEVAAIAETAWQILLEESPFMQSRQGLLVTELPDGTEERMRELAVKEQAIIERIDAVPTAQVDHDDLLTLQLIRWSATQAIEFETHWWLDFNISPYTGGMALNFIHQVYLTHPFDDPELHPANYLNLLQEYTDLIDQRRAKVLGQVERGILLPKPALPGAVGVWRSFRQGANSIFTVSDERLSALEEGARSEFQAAVTTAISERIEPALDALIEVLVSSDYQDQAPVDVGLAQYPGGKEYYRFLVRHFTTTDVTPEEVHEFGRRTVDGLNTKMAAIRRELVFEGSQQEFHEQLRTDPRFIAKSAEEMGQRLMGYVERIEPFIPDYFALTPQAPYGVERLDPGGEAGMTFGFYQQPSPANPSGIYRYNGSQLEERPMVWAGPLMYHELIPGHHFQIALQNENEGLPMIRREFYEAGAYVEGWGNYAAWLAEEMGLYDDPYERYGWALFDMFTSVRLVVDTGMNDLGWSLEEGREFMRQNTFQSETEIATESLRYSTDMPGQALGYKWGFVKLVELRQRAADLAGESFDVRDYHDAVLGPGTLPMTILEQHIEWRFGAGGE